MKFKLDENLPAEIVQALGVQGHEADGVYEEGLAGAADLVVLERARAEDRVLLTLDKGVANIQAYFTVGGFGLLQSGLLSLRNFRLLLGAEPTSGEQIGLRPEAKQVQRLIRRDLESLLTGSKI